MSDVKLPPLTRELLFKHFPHREALVHKTVWKDGIDLEFPSYALTEFAKEYAREAVLQDREALKPTGYLEPPTDTFVQHVPDKCDRIVWRGQYSRLPINTTPPDVLALLREAQDVIAKMADGPQHANWGEMLDRIDAVMREHATQPPPAPAST